MTIQTSQYAELSDIRGLRFECKKCHAVVAISLAEMIGSIPNTCINCKSTWPPFNTQYVAQALDSLVSGLRRFQEFNVSPDIGFVFSLELPKDEAEARKAKAG
jgi:hypothetical protein